MFKHFVLVGLLLLAAGSTLAQEYPKVETAPSFMYVRTPIAGQSLNCAGGGGTLAYNLNSVFGIAADLGGCKFFGNTFGLGNTLSGNQFTFLFGPRITIRNSSPFQPFFEFNLGGDRISLTCQSGALNCVNRTAGATFSKTAFALTAGGGFDIKLTRRFALRPVQAEYLYTRFGNDCPFAACNNNNNQNSFRLKSGIVMAWGGAKPVPPQASCTGTPAELLADEGPVTVSVTPADFNPKHPLTYSFNSTGGDVQKDGASAKVEVASLSPGSYTVSANVTDPKQKKMNSASCSASFTLKQPQPPVVGCSANPATIHPGDPVTLTAQGSSPDGRRIQSRKFEASAGTVKEGETTAGSQPGQWSSTATLDTAGVQPGPLKVSLAVTDVRGLSGACTASVNVEAIPLPPPVKVQEVSLVSECEFKNSRKPGRVDNECKAILDDVSLRLQREPDGKLVIVGYSEQEEEVTFKEVGSLRAVNSKKYLSAGEGQQQIDASRIEVRKSTKQGLGKKAQFYFVPAGASFSMEETTVVDESQVTGENAPAPKHQKTAPTQQPTDTGGAQ